MTKGPRLPKLLLALPSKGRLHEPALQHLADAGLHVSQEREARGYTATLTGIEDVGLVFMSAAEIANELVAGRVHFGITGDDLLQDTGSGVDAIVATVDKLGFGRADVVVAVPRAWIDVSTMADLDLVAHAFHARHHRRMRVATKFINLTRNFFKKHEVVDYRIVGSVSATEGAPAAGKAELIVDITTTGKTLADNHLKMLEDGTILESQALLAAGLRAQWGNDARRAAAALLARLSARKLAKTSQIVHVRLDRAIEHALPQLHLSFDVRVLSRPASGNTAGEVTLLVPEKNLVSAVNALRSNTDGAISTQRVEYVFLPTNEMYAKLETRLPPS